MGPSDSTFIALQIIIVILCTIGGGVIGFFVGIGVAVFAEKLVAY